MKKSNTILRISLVLFMLITWTNQSNAQISPFEIAKSNVISPVAKFVSESMTGSDSKEVRIEDQTDSEKSYLNSSLFFFNENIQVCKDIFSGKSDSIIPNTNESTAQIKKDSTENEKPEQKVLPKNKKKSFWNHPGNTKSRI